MAAFEYVGKEGVITGGEYDGFSIRIDDDRANTGGFLILVWKEGSNEGFDNWVEAEKDIEQFLYESEWVIDWRKAN